MNTKKTRRAGLPVASILMGALVGVVLARLERELRAFHRQVRFSRCAWCNDHLVDPTSPTYRAEMTEHMLACVSHPLRHLWTHPTHCLKPLIDQHIAACGEPMRRAS